MNKKPPAALPAQQFPEGINMCRADGPSVAFGLYQPALTVNHHLSVKTAITAVAGIVNNRHPLLRQGQ